MSIENDLPAEDLEMDRIRLEVAGNESLTRKQIAILVAIGLLLLVMAYGILRYLMVREFTGF